jgi:hypothetical protein
LLGLVGDAVEHDEELDEARREEPRVTDLSGHRDGLADEAQAAFALALAVVEGHGEPGEESRSQRGVAILEPGQRLRDRADHAFVDDPVPAHLPQPDLAVGECGFGEEGGVVALHRDRQRAVVHRGAHGEMAGPALGRGELEQRAGLLGGRDTRRPIEGVERVLPVDDRLVVGGPAGGLLGGEAGVRQGLLRGRGRPAGVVVGELAVVRCKIGPPHRFDRRAHPTVQAAPARRSQLAVERLCHEGVGELERPGGRLDDDPSRQRGIESLERAVGVEPAGVGEDVEVELSADHRGHPQHRLQVVREAADAPADDVAHGGGNVDRDGSRLQAPFALHQPDELGDEERVAVGALVQARCHRRQVDPGEVGRQAEQVGDVVGSESGQPQPFHVRPAHDGDERVAELPLGDVLGVAERGDDEEGHLPQLHGQEPQQTERRQVGPVQVVEDDHPRLWDRPELNGLADRVVEAEPGRLGDEVGISRRAELRHQVGEHRAEPWGERPVIDAEPAQDLHPRPQRERAFVVVAPTPARIDPDLPNAVDELVDRARLADAGLAFDDDDAGAAGPRIFDCVGEAGERIVAADERGSAARGRWPDVGALGQARTRATHGVLERRILGEDLPMEGLQLASRLDAEFVDEEPAGVGKRPQRLGLPSAAVQRPHLQRA